MHSQSRFFSFVFFFAFPPLFQESKLINLTLNILNNQHRFLASLFFKTKKECVRGKPLLPPPCVLDLELQELLPVEYSLVTICGIHTFFDGTFPVDNR